MPCLSTCKEYRLYDSKKHRKLIKKIQIWLKNSFEPPCKVKVVIRCLKNIDSEEHYYGETGKERGIFTISIEKHVSLIEVINTLLHEWAHTRTWRVDSMKHDHGDEFYLELGRIERAWDQLYDTLMKDVK